VVAASRAKDDFLAALSHELRTPLNPVLLLASDAVDNPEFSADARESFRIIENNVRLEARLIDDLLDLTRIEHGKLKMELEQIDVHQALSDAVETVRAEIAGRSLVVDLNFAAKEHTIRADPSRLQQIFWNVIKNAVKFTPMGGQIWVSTALDQSGTEIVIDIRDTGIGMAPEEIGRIFDAFAQGDHAQHGRPHRFGGLGLGLAISEKLVRLHGGRIVALSEGKECGSLFRITLPLATVVAESNVQTSSRSSGRSMSPFDLGRGRRLLLVEDHGATRASLTHLLKRRGYIVTDVATVEAALETAATQSFDLVLSDIGLPDGNGFDLMRRLRERHGMKGIALTGYGMEQDLARSTEAGFLTHLTKPIDIHLLERALEASMQRTPPAAKE
jgi:CheY-like chemotaxis protein